MLLTPRAGLVGAPVLLFPHHLLPAVSASASLQLVGSIFEDAAGRVCVVCMHAATPAQTRALGTPPLAAWMRAHGASATIGQIGLIVPADGGDSALPPTSATHRWVVVSAARGSSTLTTAAALPPIRATLRQATHARECLVVVYTVPTCSDELHVVDTPPSAPSALLPLLTEPAADAPPPSAWGLAMAAVNDGFVVATAAAAAAAAAVATGAAEPALLRTGRAPSLRGSLSDLLVARERELARARALAASLVDRMVAVLAVAVLVAALGAADEQPNVCAPLLRAVAAAGSVLAAAYGLLIDALLLLRVDFLGVKLNAPLTDKLVGALVWLFGATQQLVAEGSRRATAAAAAAAAVGAAGCVDGRAGWRWEVVRAAVGGLAVVAGARRSVDAMWWLLCAALTPMWVCAWAVRQLWMRQTAAAMSLLRLMMGSKYNVLKRRVEPSLYDMEQYAIGVMLFAVVAFLLPTVSAVHLLLQVPVLVWWLCDVVVVRGVLAALVWTLPLAATEAVAGLRPFPTRMRLVAHGISKRRVPTADEILQLASPAVREAASEQRPQSPTIVRAEYEWLSLVDC